MRVGDERRERLRAGVLAQGGGERRARPRDAGDAASRRPRRPRRRPGTRVAASSCQRCRSSGCAIAAACCERARRRRCIRATKSREPAAQRRRLEIAEHLVAERDGIRIAKARVEPRPEPGVAPRAPERRGDLVEVEVDGERRRRTRSPRSRRRRPAGRGSPKRAWADSLRRCRATAGRWGQRRSPSSRPMRSIVVRRRPTPSPFEARSALTNLRRRAATLRWSVLTTPRVVDAAAGSGLDSIPTKSLGITGRRRRGTVPPAIHAAHARRGHTPDHARDLPRIRRRRLQHEGRVRRAAHGPARPALRDGTREPRGDRARRGPAARLPGAARHEPPGRRPRRLHPRRPRRLRARRRSPTRSG